MTENAEFTFKILEIKHVVKLKAHTEIKKETRRENELKKS